MNDDGRDGHDGYILGPRRDLAYFLLSPYASPLLAALFLLLTGVLGANVTETEALFYYLFLLLFDRPHIFQTFSRTHFDPIERRRHRTFHFGLLGAGIVYAVLHPEFVLDEGFQTFFAAFGLWHIYAQNMGFLKVYGRRTGAAPALAGAERWLYRTATLVYVARGASHYYLAGSPYETAGVAAERVLLVATLGLASFVLLRWRADRDGAGLFRNPRKLFLVGLLTVTATNASLVGVVPILMLEVFETIYHDIQYLGWMAHYQETTAPKRNAAWKWLAAALAASLFFAHADRLAAPVLGTGLVFGAVYAVCVTYHYFIDGFIWKFGRQPELAPLLARR